MKTRAASIEEMIQNLKNVTLPSSLMESFDAYREATVQCASNSFTSPQLAWFLDLINRFRGSDDHKESLIDVFDPCMFTNHHPAWHAALGDRIELPSLTSDIVSTVDRCLEFAPMAFPVVTAWFPMRIFAGP